MAGATERHQRDFRRTVDSHRHVNRSDSPTHKNRRVGLPSESLENRKTRLCECTDAGQNDLTAVVPIGELPPVELMSVSAAPPSVTIFDVVYDRLKTDSQP